MLGQNAISKFILLCNRELSSLKNGTGIRIMLSSDMSLKSVITQLSHGNVGAADVLTNILKQRRDGFNRVLDIDILGLRGGRIWELYKDHCGCDINMLCNRLRDRNFIIR